MLDLIDQGLACQMVSIWTLFSHSWRPAYLTTTEVVMLKRGRFLYGPQGWFDNRVTLENIHKLKPWTYYNQRRKSMQ